MSGLWIMRLLPVIFLGVNTITDLRKKQVSLISLAVFSVAGIGAILLLYKIEDPYVSIETLRSMAFGVLAGVLLLLLSLASDGAIGKGDGLVTIIMGFYLGLWRVLVLLMGSFLTCGFFGAILLWRKRAGRKSRLPLMPFMLISYLGLITMEVILGW